MTGDGDEEALLELERRRTSTVAVLERYVNGRVPIRTQAEGYSFSWGQIVQRPPNNVMVFDFYLRRLQEAFAARGLPVLTLQERVFSVLEELTDYTLRDNLVTADRLYRESVEGWAILPGALGRGAAFSVVCHHRTEHFCRGWLITELIPLLPEIHEAVLDGLDPEA